MLRGTRTALNRLLVAAGRLTDMGLQRVDTPAEGDCQFLAVLYSARACGFSSTLASVCVYLAYVIA